jgi:hypothetical protein
MPYVAFVPSPQPVVDNFVACRLRERARKRVRRRAWDHRCAARADHFTRARPAIDPERAMACG